ncbi:unnamed protein product [Diamesa tonsa]
MFAPRNRHNKRKIIILVCVVICLYVTLFSPYSNYEYQEIIKNVKPEKVWEFVADFSKMKTLIPNMLEFKITADHGNNDDWKYSVDYLEKLSHWPYWKNNAVAHYSVKSKDVDGKLNYIVDSKHKTCFFGVYCVKSTGSFLFTEINGKDTLCTETVNYQCPPFVGSFCRKEVEFQRKRIMFNLNHHFSKNNFQ